MDVNTRAKESYQAECFTPKRSLARTPPKKCREAENISPQVAKPPRSVTSSANKKQQHLGKDGGKRKTRGTQQLGEKRTLKERNCQAEQDTCTNPKETVIDNIPPPSRWEIPRTPVRVVEHVQLQVSSATSGTTPTQRTPVRVKQPIHPLAHSNKATPIRVRATVERTPIATQQNGENCSKDDQSITKEVKPQQAAKDCDRGELGNTVTKCSSPPISVSKGIGTLPGLHCTDNDLAFLQRMQTVKEYEELKSEAEQLEKAHKTAAEQKELFQHEVLKIQHDLQNMKLSYNETSSSVVSLISNNARESQGEASPNSAAQRPVEHHQPGCGQVELTQAQLAQLRKLNQLSSARVEKTEKEVKGKLVQVERAKSQIQSKIRREEDNKLGEKTQLQSVCEAMEQEQEKWKQKLDQEEENYTSLKSQLSEAQTELATLQQQQHQSEENTASLTSDKDKSVSVSSDEKKRTVERLERIIRRCELYIKRHQMLKEMGTKM